jgi:hypothetical protein
MTDDEIRLLVRSAIARHLGPAPSGAPAATPPAPAPAMPIAFARYAIAREPDDLMCIVEPGVRCNHCGFCQVHGH